MLAKSMSDNVEVVDGDVDGDDDDDDDVSKGMVERSEDVSSTAIEVNSS